MPCLAVARSALISCREDVASSPLVGSSRNKTLGLAVNSACQKRKWVRFVQTARFANNKINARTHRNVDTFALAARNTSGCLIPNFALSNVRHAKHIDHCLRNLRHLGLRKRWWQPHAC